MAISNKYVSQLI